MAADYDVIVIGSGHNGLVCAAYLAKAGLKALVGGVSGIPGHNAAGEILRDWRKFK